MKFELPYPPSANRAWRMVRAGRATRMVISREVRAYRTETCARLAALASAPIEGSIAIVITLHPPNRRKRDVDNALKTLLDALQHAGVICDDSQIEDLRVRRGAVIEGGSAVVEITETAA